MTIDEILAADRAQLETLLETLKQEYEEIDRLLQELTSDAYRTNQAVHAAGRRAR